MDILIKNVLIVDGLGSSGYQGDIGIKDKKIVYLGNAVPDLKAQTIIDGSGLTACPGFIDSHSHADLSLAEVPQADNFIMQGITSAVGGHCGISTAPVLDEKFFDRYMSGLGVKVKEKFSDFGRWLQFMDNLEPGVNYIPLAGHNTLRGGILGVNYQREANAEEIRKINNELISALEAGAFGMSMGLDGGTPGHYAGADEFKDLLKTLQQYNAIFAPHTRHHQNQWPSETRESAYGLYVGPKGEVMTGRYHGFLEMLEYASATPRLKLMISHLTSIYHIPQPHPEYLDKAAAQATLEEIIDKPRAEGIDLFFNVVAADCSIAAELPLLASFFNPCLAGPEWLKTMDKTEFIAELSSKDFRRKLKEFINSGKFKFGMLSPVTDPYWAECYRIINCRNKDYAGKTIFELARSRNSTGVVDTVYNETLEMVFDILMTYPDTTWALIKDKREAGVYGEFLKHPRCMPCGDSAAFPENPAAYGNVFGAGVPPVSFNMMPAFLCATVKEKKTLSLTEAVRRLTSLPAAVLGIKDRGVLKTGNWADIVLLDLDKLKVYHDFTRPEAKPEGIECVLVNGGIAYQDYCFNPTRNGMVLRKK